MSALTPEQEARVREIVADLLLTAARRYEAESGFDSHRVCMGYLAVHVGEQAFARSTAVSGEARADG